MEDLTDEEAAAALYEGVNALFAAHRDAIEPDECTAMIVVEKPRAAAKEWWESEADLRERQYYVFESFANGKPKEEGALAPQIKSLRAGVGSTVRCIARRFPDHATQQVIWRSPPRIERYGKRLLVYARLIATPLGV